MANPTSFDPLVLATHVGFVRRLARGLVRGEDEADDVAAEALAAAVVQRPETGPGIRVWLRRVVARLAVRRRRAEEHRALREHVVARTNLEAREPGAGAVVAQIELEREVAIAFAALEEPWRSTLFRRYWHDLTPTQIAEETQTPLPTVKSRLQRGLELLRERLDAGHSGRREEWLGALVPWFAAGGSIVAAKSKLVPIAVAAIVVAISSVEVVAPWKNGEEDRSSASLSEPASTETAAARDVRESGVSDEPAAAERSVDPAALPFAAGVVVDAAGQPIADVAVVTRRMGRALDSEDRRTWRNWEIGFRDEWAKRDTLARSDDAGRFHVARPGDDFTGFWFVKPGFGLGEWCDLSADPAANQELRVVLLPARPLRGIVRDRDGHPIPRAHVGIKPSSEGPPEPVKRVARHLAGTPEYLSGPWAATMQGTKADADGHFEFTCARDGRYRGTANARGHAGVEANDIPDVWEPVLTRSDLILDVVDADTQQPIAGACAIVVARGSGIVQQVANPETEFVENESRPVAGALTISVHYPRGGLTWLLIAPDQTVDATIHVAAVGYHTETVDTKITAKVEPPRLRVELLRDDEDEGMPSLAGRVVGPPDSEVAIYAVQAAVRGIDPGELLRFAPHLQTRCDPDGSFAFPELPDASYLLVAKAKGCAPVRKDVKAPDRDVVLTIDTAATLEVVVKDAGGRPVGDAIVLVQDESGKNAWSKHSDPQGVARFESMPVGRLRALAIAGAGPQYFFASGREWAMPLPAFVFADSESVEASARASLRLELHPVERRTVQLHFEHDDGTPVARAKFEYCGRFTGVGRMVSSEDERLRALDVEVDALGDATVELYPGDYYFSAEEGIGRETMKIVVPRFGEATATYRLPDIRPTGTLRGRVVEWGSGMAVGGRDVKLFSMRSSGKSMTVGTRMTDPAGQFEFAEVPRGDVVLWIEGHRIGAGNDDDTPDPDSPYGFAEHRTSVETGRETTVEVELPPLKSKSVKLPTLVLEARVFDAATGAPFEDALIDVYVVMDKSRLAVASVPTGPDGRARADVFAAENYRVYVSGKADPTTLKFLYELVTLDLTPTNGILTVEAKLSRRE